MSNEKQIESSGPSRRDVLRKGAFVAGVTAVGLPTLVGTAAASEPEFCPKTPGFWKTHYPLDWPVKNGLEADECGYTINIGGAAYTPEEIFDNIFNPPTRGDKGIIMAYQLAAAALNFDASKRPSKWDKNGECSNYPDGAPESIEAVFMAANQWLDDESNFPNKKTNKWGTVDYEDETENGKDHDFSGTYKAAALHEALDRFNNDRLCECDLMVDSPHRANPHPTEFPDC